MKSTTSPFRLFLTLFIMLGWIATGNASPINDHGKAGDASSEIYLSMDQHQVIVNGGTTILIPYAYGGTPPLTFLWSNGNTNRIMEVSPDTTTTYTLVVTDATGATKSGSTTVEVITGAKPFIKVPDIQTCSDTICIPIIAGNWVDVTSISLTLDYNAQNLTYIGFKHLNYVVNYSGFNINSVGNSILIALVSISEQLNFQNDTLVEIIFKTTPSITSFNWDTSVRWKCQITNWHKYLIPFDYIGGNVEVKNCSSVEGTVVYDNIYETPLPGCQVKITDTGGKTITVVTDAQGHYACNKLFPGTYTISAVNNGPWGGVNAVDALRVLQQFVSGNILNGIRLKAADVDASGFVNTSDALKIARRYIGQIDSFNSGDWVRPVETVLLNENTTETHNIRVICYGDTDGSFVP